jgi:kynureninase
MAFWGKDPRDEFIFPLNSDIGATMVSEDDGVHHFKESQSVTDALMATASKPCVYLCGNSLGLMSKRSKTLIMEELDVWSRR